MTDINAFELEEAVLGAIMLEKGLFQRVTEIINQDCFSDMKTKYIFIAMTNLNDANSVIDILTVTNELRKMGRLNDIGGAVYIAYLTNRVASSANTEHHARIIYQYYIKRSIWKLGHDMISKAEKNYTDPFDLIDEINLELNKLTSVFSKQIKHISYFKNQIITEAKEFLHTGVKRGVETGLENIDKHIGGWQPGTLNIIAARPGMGKTAFMLAISKTSVPAGIFSLEMIGEELTGRMISADTMVPSTSINQLRLNEEELHRMINSKISDKPIFIDDTPRIDIGRLKAKARRMYHDNGVRIIFIDYLQLVRGKKEKRHEEIAEISAELKSIAKELRIPIIALSQLSREVENRQDKRPQLSDLRESGAIEQDADTVSFLWRPNEYDLYPDGYPFGNYVLQTNDDFSGFDLLIFDIVKGRAIGKGEIPLKFNGKYMIVSNYHIV